MVAKGLLLLVAHALQVLYNCRLSQRARLILAPFGARGRDAAYTLNPLAGQVRVLVEELAGGG